ncbi:MAG: MarR family transcriptional regulator [Anaerolineae bacterium]|jgi:DNA-binding MarR family transcriptional regulator|nr:MarR family transcriptional regulator [Anaerolineae bacterium]
MAAVLLSEKYQADLHGVLNCYDRVIISGNVHPLCYAKGMTGYLYANNIRIFDFPAFAQGLRDDIRSNAERIAQEHGLEIEFIRKSHSFRKEDRIREILESRGDHPGLVHIFSVMERCTAYYPWHDKQTHKTFVKSRPGKCLHYYFYFIDENLGLCYLRVSTWCPFRLQFYFNGHNWLANRLKQRGVTFELRDNAFLQIEGFDLANQLAAQLDIKALHATLNRYAPQYCPVVTQLGLQYSWSIMQAEYATDLVFKSQEALQAFYPHLLETLILAVKPDDVATFLGRKLHGNYQGEMGNRFNARWLGTRIKHQMGPVTIKMYDKFNIVLRIETTTNDVSFFKQYRRVHHRDGTTSTQWAAMKKIIYSLPALRESLLAANQRYLKFISEVETPEIGVQKLQQLTETKEENDHRYKGFNLLAEEDASVFRALVRGEFLISGFTNKDLRRHLDKTSAQVTRLLKRLRVHGLIKKVGRQYKYYLTQLGRQVVLMLLKLREMVVIPELAYAQA